MKQKLAALLILAFLLPLLSVNAQEVERFTHQNKDAQKIIKRYREVYLPAKMHPEGYVEGKACDPGYINKAGLDARQRQLNFFRELAGVNPIVFTEENNKLAQAAAHLMQKNGGLSHSPPSSWKCYSALGAQGAGSCNLGYGGGMESYMDDYGDGNRSCGHRMWILASQKTEMGYGGTGITSAIYVFGKTQKATRLPEYVTWPTSGFFPAELANSRWSFSIPGLYADFANASVKVTFEGKELPLEYAEPTSYGDGGIAFELKNWNNLNESLLNKIVNVSIKNIKIGTMIKSYQYQVSLIECEEQYRPGLAVETQDQPSFNTSDEAFAMEPEIMEVALVDRTLVSPSQFGEEEGLMELMVNELARKSGVKIKYAESYASLANRISEIRKEKDPDATKLKAWVGKKVTEIATGKPAGSGAEASSTTTSKYLLLEIKKVVPAGGKATFGKIAEVMANEFLEKPELKTYLLKNPTVRNAAMGFDSKSIVRDGKTCYGLYVTLLVAPPAK